MSYADLFANSVETKGLVGAFNDACQHIRNEEARQVALWDSRFFELRTLQDGRKKLVSTTERSISSSVDLADGEEPPTFLWQDDAGVLHPVTFGHPVWTTSDDDRTTSGSGTMVANGHCVGMVHYTDH